VSISRMCVSIDVHFFCASFCVSKEKNFVKHIHYEGGVLREKSR
jgi:hypothetical protein